MYANLIHRIVIMLAFLIALVVFACNVYFGADILYSAFWALCVLFGVATVMLIAMQAVAQVLFKHLQDKREIIRQPPEE